MTERGKRRLEILCDQSKWPRHRALELLVTVKSFYPWLQPWIKEYVDWVEDYEVEEAKRAL